MSAQENIELTKRFYELLSAMQWEKLTELIHEDFTFISQVDTPMDFEGFLGVEKSVFEAFPDVTMPVEQIFADGDWIAARVLFQGTHTGGPYKGIPVTGRKLKISAGMFLKFADGKIIEKRAHFDVYDMFKQLGINFDDYIKILSEFARLYK